MMASLLPDIRYTTRSVFKDWRFAAMVMLTLSVCIGVNTALFTIINSVLLQPLPVPGADAVVLMAHRYPKSGVNDSNNSAAGDYYDRMRDVTALQDQAMFSSVAFTMNANAPPERVSGMAATPSLFRLLRVAPALGRAFTDNEAEIGSAQKVMPSYRPRQNLYPPAASPSGPDLNLNPR